jgi:hypothetical protein
MCDWSSVAARCWCCIYCGCDHFSKSSSNIHPNLAAIQTANIASAITAATISNEFCARTLAAATVSPFRFVPTEMDERATTFAGLLAMLVVYEWWSESCESERHL